MRKEEFRMIRTAIAMRYEHAEFLLRSLDLQLCIALRCPETICKTGPEQPAV